MHVEISCLDSNSKIIRLFKSGFDEILFQDRNKTYGAYQLRFISRAGFVVGFVATLLMTGIAISFFSFIKPKGAKPDRYVEYEIYDPNIKTTPLLKEPPKGEANGEVTEKKEKPTKPSKNTQKKETIDPKRIEKEAKDLEIAKAKAKQDSLDKALADSLARKQHDDSLRAAEDGKNKLGNPDGKGTTNVDTTHHKPIGGDDAFAAWIANLLQSKYTPELKAYGRKVTFTIGYNVNSDSTITDFKIYQKAYFGMDPIIIETLTMNPKKMIPYKNERGELIKSQYVKRPITLLPLPKK